ncbi:FadR/GntR family transcriptional regulator [Pseudomonas graminis]|uniref:FadR/GntR family transcriptional regulator n=1 Tax=Pseudomonas graminis TaxID=158627 RepID=UPI00234ACA9E|nr:FadR/GntR family transcriptional regulator [Pseudomonas graminis]MDC6383551.1 FadR/GntR family transcriptional regulator [Pseudomonas graminis]
MTAPNPAPERRLYQITADRLREHIRKHGIAPGARLPPERDLAQLLGVSRPSLREALIALEIEGSVEIRMGSGIYVCEHLLGVKGKTRTLGESPSELMQARALIEGESVMLACLHGSKADFRYLQGCIDKMREGALKGVPALDDDRKFHQRLAKMSGNSTLVRIITSLFEERYSPLTAHVSEHSETRETWAMAVAEHEAILQAVQTRDLIGAQTAMREHLRRSEARWLDGMEAELR